MGDLNATAASLLGFLHDGPKTGWDLLQQAADRQARDRQPYTITSEGRAAFTAWLT